MSRATVMTGNQLDPWMSDVGCGLKITKLLAIVDWPTVFSCRCRMGRGFATLPGEWGPGVENSTILVESLE